MVIGRHTPSFDRLIPVNSGVWQKEFDRNPGAVPSTIEESRWSAEVEMKVKWCAAGGASRDLGFAREGNLRTHVIVQSVGVCLLLVWTTVWDVPVSDAGGPPVRLAIGRQRVQRREHSEGEAPNVKESDRAQLIPTEFGQRTAQLIPTEVEPGSVLAMKAVRDDRIIAANLTRTVCDEIHGFLDPHLQNGPCRLNQTPRQGISWRDWKLYQQDGRVLSDR